MSCAIYLAVTSDDLSDFELLSQLLKFKVL